MTMRPLSRLGVSPGIALGLTLAHGALLAAAGSLPERAAALLAGSLYGPLWLLSAVGLPVYGPAESGGWRGPGPLGWLLVAAFWFVVWFLAVSALRRLRR